MVSEWRDCAPVSVSGGGSASSDEDDAGVATGLASLGNVALAAGGLLLGVDVMTKPNDRALNFCIERAVRQMTWLKELAVNKVKVSF